MTQSTTDGELDPVATTGGSAATEAATGLTTPAVNKQTPTTDSNTALAAAEHPTVPSPGLEGTILDGGRPEDAVTAFQAAAVGAAGPAAGLVVEPLMLAHEAAGPAAADLAVSESPLIGAQPVDGERAAEHDSASHDRSAAFTRADEVQSPPRARSSSSPLRGERGTRAVRDTVRASWRGFPMWERRALAVIVLFAAVMYGWEAAHASYHGFYAVAVKSMTTGWRAFIFGALDPNASITIDKIPGFLWPQALSAMVFGFHPWSLALPQSVEGLVTVLALHRAVRRWIGPGAGLTAAAIFALTPVVASLFGKVLEDAALTCLLVLAAAAWQRAVETGRLRSLVFCGVWVGLAFQAKMLQSWAVLPAFALAYLIAAPPRFAVRLRHTLVAGGVCLLVSLSWVIIATLTPAADRPYVDGSTNNSAAAMVFGYNGLARFGSVGVSAAGTGSVAATQGTRFGGSSSGWAKLMQHELASQVGWLIRSRWPGSHSPSGAVAVPVPT